MTTIIEDFTKVVEAVIAAQLKNISERLTALEQSKPVYRDMFYYDFEDKCAYQTQIGMDLYEPDHATREQLQKDGNWFATKEEAEAYGMARETITPTDSVSGEKITILKSALRGTTTEDFNPARDGFWYWDIRTGDATGVASNPMTSYYHCLISIGNWFRTREEAEDMGKWLFQDKLVLDEKLRQFLKATEYESVYDFRMYWDWGRNEIRFDFCDSDRHDFPYASRIAAILGNHAKRYLTGEAS